MRFPLEFRQLRLGFLLWGPLIFAFFIPAQSAAQQQAGPSVTVNPLVTRTLPNGASATIRPQNLNPTGISFEDCEENQQLNFSLTLGGPPWTSYHLEAWVGNTDCTQSNARNPNSGAANCWPAAPQGITPAQTISVPVRTQDVVAHEVDQTKPGSYSPAGEEACHVQDQSGAVSLSIYFIWLDGTGNAVGTAGKYDLKTDLRGPDAPGGVSAGQGDTLLVVNWSPAVDTDTQGFNVYCDPPPGQEGTVNQSAADAGTQTTLVCQDGGFSDGGFDDAGNPLPGEPLDGGCTTVVTTPGSTTGASSCPSTVLIGGGGTTTTDEAGVTSTTGSTQTLIDPKYLCRTLGGSTNTSATLEGLQNGTVYTVAVAGTDGFGNVGPLSDPSCTDPVPVDDFWKTYRESGGQAGGGFCGLTTARTRGASLFASAMFFAALLVCRRRRRP